MAQKEFSALSFEMELGKKLDPEDKGNLLSTTECVVQLLYNLVDENFREARKLDDVHTFLTKDDILGKLFKPDGPHHDILKSYIKDVRW